MYSKARSVNGTTTVLNRCGQYVSAISFETTACVQPNSPTRTITTRYEPTEMTSQLPGTEWAHNAAPPSARPSTPLHPSPWPHGVSLSLSTPGQWHTNAGSDDGTAERATKRQKVDNRGHSRAPSTATSTHTPTAYFDTSILTQGDEESATDRHQPATERSFHETSVKTRGGEPKARLHLPLPPRPPSRATRTAGVTHRGPTGRSKLPVQIQPYLPEVPARAPRFDGASMYWPNLRKSLADIRHGRTRRLSPLDGSPPGGCD